MSTITTYIPRISDRMSPLSQAILLYVSEHPDCSFTALHTLFSPSANGIGREGFRARLGYLVSVGHLQRRDIRGISCYRTGDGARPPKPVPEPVPEIATPAGYWQDASGNLIPQFRTPAPCYDLKNAPAYVPEAGPALRAGALDFKRYASVGHSC
jgi:hypothetical protein